MSSRTIGIFIRRVRLHCGTKFWVRHRILSAITFTLLFAMMSTIIKKICWEMYLLAPQQPVQPWMDPREQALIIKYLQKSDQATR